MPTAFSIWCSAWTPKRSCRRKRGDLKVHLKSELQQTTGQNLRRRDERNVGDGRIRAGRQIATERSRDLRVRVSEVCIVGNARQILVGRRDLEPVGQWDCSRELHLG